MDVFQWDKNYCNNFPSSSLVLYSPVMLEHKYLAVSLRNFGLDDVPMIFVHFYFVMDVCNLP